MAWDHTSLEGQRLSVDPSAIPTRRPASFGRSRRDPDVERPRLREVGSGRSTSASLGFDRNTLAFFASFWVG